MTVLKILAIIVLILLLFAVCACIGEVGGLLWAMFEDLFKKK